MPASANGSTGSEWMSARRLEVLVDDLAPVGVVGSVEVVLPGHLVHDERSGLVDPAVHRRYGRTVFVQETLEAHLVGEREREVHVDAIAADAEVVGVAVDGDGREPHGTPARLAREVDDLGVELGLEPTVN